MRLFFALMFLLAQAKAQNSFLFGVTTYGGAYGNGTLFRFDPLLNKDTALFHFTTLAGENPMGHLIQATNGLLYGMTVAGGNYNHGVIYKYDPLLNTQAVVHHFNDTLGALPTGGYLNSSLVTASNGMIYGVTPLGGNYMAGVIFSYDINSGNYVVMHHFNDTSGSGPSSPVQATNGLLYGMCQTGGKYGYGVAYSFDPVSGIYDTLFSFNGVNGAVPLGGLIEATDGSLYGMAGQGGTLNYGTLFRYNLFTGKDTVLMNLYPAFGIGPYGGLLQATNGLLYGMTTSGGSGPGLGTLFSYDPVNYKDSLLIDFNYNNGDSPLGNLMQASDGMLYGLTSEGGDSMYGVLYRLNPLTNEDSVLLSFKWAQDGAMPYGDVLEVQLPVTNEKPPELIDEVRIYPSPAADMVNISLPANTSGKIRIYNALGLEVYGFVLEPSVPGRSFTISTSDLPDGIYYLKFSGKKNLVPAKMVISR